MTEIGIMQGRLVPPVDARFQAFPRDRWRDEFPAAAEAGLNFIEWIFDEYGFDSNPLRTDAGIAELRALTDRYGIAIPSVCADYFMERPLLKCSRAEQDERMAILSRLFARAKQLGIHHIVLPFVDASRMDSEDEIDRFVALANDVLMPIAEQHEIEAHLETSLPPKEVAGILDRIPHPLFWINYDSGNSSSLGYPPVEEFGAYGHRIGSFHIKDRVKGGGTVPLGTGDADFVTLKRCLGDYGYSRAYVLQVARGEAGQEVAWARNNVQLAKELVIPTRG